ncbi:Hsp70 family protein [Dactylosporangium sp. NPDC050588]|uniref:Hsp70 family protein n=1 Tax=Dactylosporangium sp. NPDC050588 TaxID=3157211 RepID=UPI0033DFD513
MTAQQSGLSIDFGTSHTVGMLLGTHEVPVADAVAAVLDRVRSEAERTLGGPAGEVVLTHPASWAPIRRTLLADAARAAGLGTPVLVPEPVAAATCFTAVLSHRVDPGAAVVVYDLGGGTFDVSVVRRTATSWDVVASDGFEDVGGVDLDAAVVGWVGRTAGGADPQRWQRLAAPETTADRRLRRELQEDARIAKEQLSRANQTGLPVPLLDVDVHLTRGELEDLARPMLDRTVARHGRPDPARQDHCPLSHRAGRTSLVRLSTRAPSGVFEGVLAPTPGGPPPRFPRPPGRRRAGDERGGPGIPASRYTRVRKPAVG